jgi:hypothetical protein
MLAINGICIGIIEIVIYLLIASELRRRKPVLQKMNILSYYWMIMTVLTGIWEFTFVMCYKYVVGLANDLLLNKQHVWTKHYDVTYVLPWKLSPIFYSEYGAYADREYMCRKDDWSRVIESTHALWCGIFALVCINQMIAKKKKNYLVAMSVAMGTQVMNSILYMMNYFNEMGDSENVNYNNESFPAGIALVKRPFMWVNIFWTVLPIFVIVQELCKKNTKK